MKRRRPKQHARVRSEEPECVYIGLLEISFYDFRLASDDDASDSNYCWMYNRNLKMLLVTAEAVVCFVNCFICAALAF